MFKFNKYAFAIFMATSATAAQAGLIDLGRGMIYDDALNITWLSDWNYAKTSGFNSNGTMDQPTAKNWTNNLIYAGSSGWRLPSAHNADGSGPCGKAQPIINPEVNCSGSEMGHLFYVDLGGNAYESVLNQTGDTAQQIANMALFTNVSAETYWFGTEFAPFPQEDAWAFDFWIGGQLVEWKGIHDWRALVVHDGIVAEPKTALLALLALGAFAALRRRVS